ncbi:response regulator transcription factor [Kineosporia succinea]|uniref:DNA-binding response OmpR family regulator n=1 Tax=Kineosporia succinea TaxID=84632 RepID=A0ABT9PE95_9ACTN|nr:response regulator transcription factor [Kineosporia succinea]MDP9830300.1 DNA-binding response OmpR family regulator [Kineosporia succinea]
MARVMVAEDDHKQAELVRAYLTHEGHEAVVVTRGRAVLEQVRLAPPDLLVLDLMLPEVDGWEVCRRLRAEHTLPILMVTARSTVEDRLLGLDLGADDYLTKPYDPRELMARVRALLRRAQVSPERAVTPAVLGVGDLRLDPDQHEVTIDGVPVTCTSGEFLILETLLASPGRVFTRAQLLDRTRGSSQNVTERTIDVHVSNLRRKIERDPRTPRYLLTVFGVGYKLGPGA